MLSSIQNMTRKQFGAAMRAIRVIESEVYPVHMQMMQEVYSRSDLEEYVEEAAKDISILVEPHRFYVIFTKQGEIVDLASVDVLSLSELSSLLELVLRETGRRSVTMDCRESTSMKLVRFLCRSRRDGFNWSREINYEWDWEGEVMYNLILTKVG